MTASLGLMIRARSRQEVPGQKPAARLTCQEPCPIDMAFQPSEAKAVGWPGMAACQIGSSGLLSSNLGAYRLSAPLSKQDIQGTADQTASD